MCSSKTQSAELRVLQPSSRTMAAVHAVLQYADKGLHRTTKTLKKREIVGRGGLSRRRGGTSPLGKIRGAKKDSNSNFASGAKN